MKRPIVRGVKAANALGCHPRSRSECVMEEPRSSVHHRLLCKMLVTSSTHRCRSRLARGGWECARALCTNRTQHVPSPSAMPGSLPVSPLTVFGGAVGGTILLGTSSSTLTLCTLGFPMFPPTTTTCQLLLMQTADSLGVDAASCFLFQLTKAVSNTHWKVSFTLS